ncbi:MAG: heat-inducible transcription repressor HrcA [Myxococcales bacterium]|nr:heat-inducible transcription repressor HrcA [Myxococcales bacterium]
MVDINHRSRKILHAVVSEYLTTGDAVGSRKVTRRHGIDLSPATVRNVMADLEEAGLLEQPHTSSGRVPTGTGLRFFIDSLLKVRGLSTKEKESIRMHSGLGHGEGDFDSIIQNTSRVLSEVTNYAGIVLAPNPAQDQLQHIEFMPMSGGSLLAVLVTESGQIVNKLIKLESELDRPTLERVHNYLLDLLGGLTLGEVRKKVLVEMGEEKNQYDTMVSAALKLGHAAVSGVEDDGEIFVSGQANLIVPGDSGQSDVGSMRDLLAALEQKELILKLLDDTMSTEQVKVFLGAETAHAALGESSIVAVPYGPDEQPLGAIAVIGPTRMNYGKIMSVVDFTAELVSRLALER